VVVDLIQNEVMDNSGDIYALGEDGYFYNRDVSGNWSVQGNVSDGAYGMLYRKDQDAIYLASSKTVSLFGPISTGPSLNPDFYGPSFSTYDNTANATFNVSAYTLEGAFTIAVPTSIAEETRRYFQSDIEPLNKIDVFVVAKGAGDFTLTLHDGLDNVIATSTLANADIEENAWNSFTFTTQVRIQVAPSAQTYHFHVTSTASGGTLSTTQENSFAYISLMIWADRLVNPVNGMHPMAQIQQFVIIGNERYLSVWEPLGSPEPSNTEWQRHKLQFPPQYEVCGIDKTSEYAAIACEVVATDPNQDPQGGIIFFWDGLSSTYNFFIEVPEGSPYGLHVYKNVLYYEAGGAWYALQPFADAQPTKIRTLPSGENTNVVNNNQTKVYPYAATTRNGVQLMAWPSATTNETIPYGIYSWGSVDKNFPNSFGYSYLPSTLEENYTPSNDLRYGMVKNFGDTLHISWQDSVNGGYGVDVVTSESPVAPYATWESRIFDNGYVGKEKEGDYMDATWLELPEGVEIVLKYSINRGEWEYSDRFSSSNVWMDFPGYARFSIGQENEQGRFYEIQVGIDVYCEDGVSETPTVTSCTLIYDNNVEDQLE
jgi:hypothetical protein